MITDSYDLNNIVENPNETIVKEWRYNDFDFGKEYDIILLDFPNHEIKKINDKMNYFIFKGIILNGAEKIICDKIFLSQQNFYNAYIKFPDKQAIKKTKDIKFKIIRQTQRVLEILDISFDF